MWGIFGKPLKRVIWNTPGLQVALMVCLRFLSFLDAACCLLPDSVNRQPPCPHTNSRNVPLHPQMHHRAL